MFNMTYLKTLLTRPALIFIFGILFLLVAPGAFGADLPGNNLDVLQLAMGLFGGLALFLGGLDLLSEGLKKAAGETLKTLLSKMTTNRFLGAITGAFVTAVLNSSSVTTVLVVSFITAGVMTLAQSDAMCHLVPDSCLRVAGEASDHVDTVEPLGLAQGDGVLERNSRNAVVRSPGVDLRECAPPGVAGVDEARAVRVFEGTSVVEATRMKPRRFGLASFSASVHATALKVPLLPSSPLSPVLSEVDHCHCPGEVATSPTRKVFPPSQNAGIKYPPPGPDSPTHRSTSK